VTVIRPPEDIIGRNVFTGQWWLGLSNGSTFTSFQPMTWSTGVTWVDVQTGDFNGDGLTDIVGRAKDTGDWWMSMANSSGGCISYPSTAWVDVHHEEFV
jgi:hypothetical protein